MDSQDEISSTELISLKIVRRLRKILYAIKTLNLNLEEAYPMISPH
jgi:hypothetical protein